MHEPAIEQLEAWAAEHAEEFGEEWRPSDEAWAAVYRRHPAEPKDGAEAAERYYEAHAQELLIRYRRDEAQQKYVRSSFAGAP